MLPNVTKKIFSLLLSLRFFMTLPRCQHTQGYTGQSTLFNAAYSLTLRTFQRYKILQKIAKYYKNTPKIAYRNIAYTLPTTAYNATVYIATTTQTSTSCVVFILQHIHCSLQHSNVRIKLPLTLCLALWNILIYHCCISVTERCNSWPSMKEDHLHEIERFSKKGSVPGKRESFFKSYQKIFSLPPISFYHVLLSCTIQLHCYMLPVCFDCLKYILLHTFSTRHLLALSSPLIPLYTPTPLFNIVSENIFSSHHFLT